MKINKTPYFLSDMATIFLLLLFIISLFLITMTGISSYNKVEENASVNYANRSSVYYLYHKVKEFDIKGGIDILNGEQGDTILLKENIDDNFYETRILMKDGSLIEQFSLKGKDNDVEGTHIANINSFKAKFERDNLIYICVDDNDIYINLLSEV